VALDKTSALLKAASANVLRFKTDGVLPTALAARARITGRIVQLPANSALDIEQYLAAVREAGVAVEDVEIRRADLEDVFLDVMNTARADEVTV
jgi:ABC-2 type transport system ATP-binding protein